MTVAQSGVVGENALPSNATSAEQAAGAVQVDDLEGLADRRSQAVEARQIIQSTDLCNGSSSPEVPYLQQTSLPSSPCTAEMTTFERPARAPSSDVGESHPRAEDSWAGKHFHELIWAKHKSYMLHKTYLISYSNPYIYILSKVKGLESKVHEAYKPPQRSSCAYSGWCLLLSR